MLVLAGYIHYHSNRVHLSGKVKTHGITDNNTIPNVIRIVNYTHNAYVVHVTIYVHVP